MKKDQFRRERACDDYDSRVVHYLVERSAVAEDEVDGALDEAVVEVVKALVVVECVLSTDEATVVEGGFCAGDSQRHRLASNGSHFMWSRVLPKSNLTYNLVRGV